MDTHNQEYRANGVNGSFENRLLAASPGRDDHLRRVSPVRHHATVGDVRARQADSRGQRATVSEPNRRRKRIATWNVRSLLRAGKINNVAAEANRMKLDIVGLSEVRWPGVSQVTVSEYELVYSGSEEHTGVGVMLRKEVARCMEGYWAVSDRVLMVKLKGNPFNTTIIQVYAPTGDHSEEEVDAFYEDLHRARRQAGSQDVVIVMGDWNAKIGRGREGRVVGPFGLGVRNDRGDKLYEWCAENEQAVMNTWFKHHPRFLWTWKSPGDYCRNQIDYITINHRFRNSVTQVKTYPGADCGSDHSPVVATLEVRLKKLVRRRRKPVKDLNKLKMGSELGGRYAVDVRNRFEALPDEDCPEAQWTRLQEALNGAAEEVIPNQERQMKQEWMNEGILEKMEQRRLKKNSPQEYRRIDREIKEDCSRAKDRWLNEQCIEIERLENIDLRIMHNKIKEMTGSKNKKAGWAIKKSNGDIAMGKEEVKQRWSEYTKELFHDERRNFEVSEEDCNDGLPIMKSEVEDALRAMKRGKAVGEDGIAIEMIEVMEEWGVEVITRLVNSIYDTGQIPGAMKRSIFVTMPKKAGAIDCDKFRTISITSQLCKIVLRIVLCRIKNTITSEISDEQYGFMKGKGTNNAIFVLRMLGERSIEMQKDIFLCFIDYEKAFDTVRHMDLLTVLSRLQMGGKEMRIIRNLYYDQTAAVRVGDELAEWVEIERGVRQGCVMSPLLFSIYGEIIMREIGEMDGISVGGRNLNNIRYADDTVLIADSEEKLQRLVERVDAAGEEMGLRINKKKTECLVISKRTAPACNIRIREEAIKQVDKFKYLGSVVTVDGRCESEIRQRIGIAKNAFDKMRNMLTNRHIRINTRIRVIKTYVWSTLLYGCESWTISKDMERRLEAFEVWCWRRMMRVSWMERRTNVSIFEEIGRERELLRSIRRRQMRFLGHVMRREQLENVSLTGRISGARGRGRPRIKYMDGLRKAIGEGLRTGEILQMTRDREVWKSMIANVFSDTALR